MPSGRNDKAVARSVARLHWFLRKTDTPTKKPKNPAEMFENHTPPVEIQIVFLLRRLAWIGGITHYFHISNNHYICTMTILLVPTFGLAVGLEYFPGDNEWPTSELVLNVLIFKIVIQWQ